MDGQGVWTQILNKLKEQCSGQQVELWFDSVKFVGREQDKILLSVPNPAYKYWIMERFGVQLKNQVCAQFGEELKMEFLIQPQTEEKQEFSEALPKGAFEKTNSLLERVQGANLNPKYIFENFVVGPCNQFAHAASKAVAENDRVIYNPLFIYGGVGLGKTHLLNAIGNKMLERNPDLRVICIQAETFMNELITAIHTQQVNEFRRKFRKRCELLLMDDIEILCGKERTQEEFFYTFNELYESGRQIVMTSDRLPSELPELTERLRSRFESGMLVDIQIPEYETKLAIIKRKAEESGLTIPDEVGNYLAKNIRSNIRKLEGCLVRICAYASLTGENITIDLVKRILDSILLNGEKELNPEKIIKVVANVYGVRVQEIKGEKRMRKFVLPRQVAMFLCRKLLKQSFPEIGGCFGDKDRIKDHSTVIHSVRKISENLNKDQDLRKKIERILNELNVHEEIN